jgi:hypothetical protein
MTDADIMIHYHAKLKTINNILKTDDAAVFKDVLYDMARNEEAEEAEDAKYISIREASMARTLSRIWDITHPMFCALCGKFSVEWAKEGLNALEGV